ncbi:MAG: rRNA pseudouridine synthase [Candidatus Doudnabacteria bacterium]|nr:rRNA pseudouridine synthase [Candidatus Doudnabacteria bacterium]
MQERIQKFLSSAGLASRRKAEEFIKSGQVTVNGKKAKLGDKIDPSKDSVKVYGKAVKPAEEKIYLMLNKPKGYMVSKSDPRGRKTVFSLLPEELRNKLWNVGRLDFATEGLLIMTNDGDLTQELSHPKYEHEKEYEVETYEQPNESQLEHLRHGVEIPTGLTSEAQVKLKNNKVYITLHEGKKRQIRRMFDAVGLSVTALRRIRMNKLKLPPDLPPGQFRMVSKESIL